MIVFSLSLIAGHSNKHGCYYQSVLVCASDEDELVTSHSFVTWHRSRTVLPLDRKTFFSLTHRDILHAGGILRTATLMVEGDISQAFANAIDGFVIHECRTWPMKLKMLVPRPPTLSSNIIA
jgi:hypothetical protein